MSSTFHTCSKCVGEKNKFIKFRKTKLPIQYQRLDDADQ